MMYGLPSPQETFDSLKEHEKDPVMVATILEQLCTALVMGIQEYLVAFNAAIGLNALLVVAGKVPTTVPDVAKIRESFSHRGGAGTLSVLVSDYDCTLYALRCIGNIAEHVPSSAAAIRAQLNPLLNFLIIVLLQRVPKSEGQQQRYLGDPSQTYQVDFLMEELVKVVQLVALEDANNATIHSGLLALLAQEFLPCPSLDLRSKQVIIEALQNVSQRLLPASSQGGLLAPTAAASRGRKGSVSSGTAPAAAAGSDVVIDALHAIIVEAERRRQVLGAKEWRIVAAACECLDTIILRSHATGDSQAITRAAGGDGGATTSNVLTRIMGALFNLAHAPENPHQLLTITLLSTIGRGAPSLMRRALCATPAGAAPGSTPPAYALMESLLKVSEHSEIDVFLQDPFQNDRDELLKAYAKKAGSKAIAPSDSTNASNQRGKRDPLLIAAALQLLSICTPPVQSSTNADSMLLLLRDWSWEDDMHAYTHYLPEDAKTLEKVLMLGVEHIYVVGTAGRQYTVDTASMKQVRGGSLKNSTGAQDYGSDHNAERIRALAAQFASGSLEGSRNVRRIVTPTGYTLVPERRTHLARDYKSAGCVEESAELLVRFGRLLSRFAISSSDATFKFVAVQFIAQCFQFMGKATTKSRTSLIQKWLQEESPAVWDLVLDSLQTASLKSSDSIHQFASNKIREANKPQQAEEPAPADDMGALADGFEIFGFANSDDEAELMNPKPKINTKKYRKPTPLQSSALAIAEQLVSHPEEGVAVAGIQAGLRRGADDIIGNLCTNLEQADAVTAILARARSGRGWGGADGAGDNDVVKTLQSSLKTFTKGSKSYQTGYLPELVAMLGSQQVQLMTPFEFSQLGIARTLINFLSTDDDTEYTRRAELFAACLVKSPQGCQNLVRKLVDALPFLNDFPVVECTVSDKPARCRSVLEALEVLSAVSPQVELCQHTGENDDDENDGRPQLCCTKGHKLPSMKLSARWMCNLCRKEGDVATYAKRCETCDYDLCSTCFTSETNRYSQGSESDLKDPGTNGTNNNAVCVDDEEEDEIYNLDDSFVSEAVQAVSKPTFRIPAAATTKASKKGDDVPKRVSAHLMATVGDIESYFRGSKSPLAVRMQVKLEEFEAVFEHLSERIAKSKKAEQEAFDSIQNPTDEDLTRKYVDELRWREILEHAESMLQNRKNAVRRALGMTVDDGSRKGDNSGGDAVEEPTYQGRLELFNKGLGRCSYQETLYSVIYKKVKLLLNTNHEFYHALLLELEKAIMTEDLGGRGVGGKKRPPPPPPQSGKKGGKKIVAAPGLGLGVHSVVPDFPANRFLPPTPPVPPGGCMTLGQIEQTSLIATRNVMFHFFKEDDTTTLTTATSSSPLPDLSAISSGASSAFSLGDEEALMIAESEEHHVDPTAAIDDIIASKTTKKAPRKKLCVCGAHNRDELSVNDTDILEHVMGCEDTAISEGEDPAQLPEAILLSLIHDLYRHAVAGNYPSDLVDSVVMTPSSSTVSMEMMLSSVSFGGSDGRQCSSLADVLTPELFVSTPLSKRVVHSLSACALRVALLDPRYAIPKWAHSFLTELPFILTPVTRQRSAAFLAYQARRSLWELLRDADARAPADVAVYPSEWVPAAANVTSLVAAAISGRQQRVAMGGIKRHLVDGTCLLSSTQKLLQETAELRLPLSIQVKGEVGTGLGPTLQFYTDVSKALCKRRSNETAGSTPPRQFWRQATDESNDTSAKQKDGFVAVGKEGLFPNILDLRDHVAQKEAEEMFYVLGGLLARGYMDQRIVPMPLSPMLIHYLRVGKPYVVRKEEDIEDSKKTNIRNERVVEDGHGNFILPSTALSKLRASKTATPTVVVTSPHYRGTLSSRNIVHVDRSLHASLKSLRQYAKKTRDPSLTSSEQQAATLALEMMDLPFILPGSPDASPHNPGGALLLHPDGEDRILNGDNASQYLTSVVEGTLYWGVARQIEAFLNGFSDVLPVGALQLLSTAELTRALCGVGVDTDGEGSLWTIDDLNSVLVADHGYSKDSDQVKWLREVLVHDLSRKQQEDFLEFLTGCPRLPVGGFRSLGNITVVKKSNQTNTNNNSEDAPSSPIKTTATSTSTPPSDDNVLISVNTCFHYLKVPPYSTKELLRKRLVESMEGSAGFDLS